MKTRFGESGTLLGNKVGKTSALHTKFDWACNLISRGSNSIGQAVSYNKCFYQPPLNRIAINNTSLEVIRKLET